MLIIFQSNVLRNRQLSLFSSRIDACLTSCILSRRYIKTDDILTNLLELNKAM